MIGDPCGEGVEYYVGQATHAKADKGHALRRYIDRVGGGVPVIAAGDDNNDIPMLETADVAIAMGTAAGPIRAIADLVAPSAKEYGIIAGLKAAIEYVEERCEIR